MGKPRTTHWTAYRMPTRWTTMAGFLAKTPMTSNVLTKNVPWRMKTGEACWFAVFAHRVCCLLLAVGSFKQVKLQGSLMRDSALKQVKQYQLDGD